MSAQQGGGWVDWPGAEPPRPPAPPANPYAPPPANPYAPPPAATPQWGAPPPPAGWQPQPNPEPQPAWQPPPPAGWQPQPQWGQPPAPQWPGQPAAPAWDPAAGFGNPAYGRPDGSHARPFPVGRRLGFVDSLRAGWRLAGTSWRVLTADRELLFVPLVALLAGIAVFLPYTALLGGPAALLDGGKIEFAVKVFPVMFVLCVLDVFAAATVVGAATIRLAGGNPTLTDGWVQALSRAPKLIRFAFAWAVQQTISAWLRQRGRGGQIAADLLDTAWNIATFLAIPVLLYEPDLSTTRAVRRSAQLVGGRWGAGLVGNASLQTAVFLAGLPVVLGLALLGSVFGVSGAVAGAIVGFVAVISVASALRGIYSAALYRFALTGLTAGGFREIDMWQAFARPTKR